MTALESLKVLVAIATVNGPLCYLIWGQRQRRYHEARPVQIVERYADFQIIGRWGVVSGGECKVGGNMIGETVKCRHSDGSVRMLRIFITEQEKDNPERGNFICE